MFLSLLLALFAPPTPKYPVAAISAPLRENAHAVVRAHDEVVAVKSASRLVRTVHRAVTVLDPAGSEEFGRLIVDYDALRKLSYLRGAVYDADGKLLRQLRPQDGGDQGLGNFGGSLMTDVRVRYADLRQPTTPYTVEWDYEIVSDNLLFYPDWQPQSTENLALERATLQVSTPAALALRYQEQALPAGAAAVPGQAAPGANGQLAYRWELHDLPAVEEEPLAPPLAALLPTVYLAPTAFEVQGHAGTLDSWQSLGRWNYELNAGRDQLPPALVAEMAALARAEPDPRARARKVYQRLQSSTRYVSVQLGIGGWQTAPAGAVAATGYGDCKALSNYTRALLQAAGLPAHVALVGAGADEPDVRAGFPSSQFNHAIVCLPLPAAGKAPADTTWLECTSQTEAFGYLGSFTGNRHALLLTPGGGQLVATPRYRAADNRQQRRADLWLDPAGNATATVRTRRLGPAQDRYAQLLHEGDPEEQKKYVRERLHLGHFTLTKLQLVAEPPRPGAGGQPLPAVAETLGLTLPNWASAAGKRLLVEPNLLGRLPALPAQVGARQSPVLLPPAALYQDTVRLHLPAGFRAETLPQPVQLSTPYGTYAAQCTALPDGTLQYVRRLELLRPAGSGQLPASAYAGYAEFRRKIRVADGAQLVLVKTDA